MKIDTKAIIDIIAERADIREDQAREHLNQLIEVIRTETATGGAHEIEGFGTFYREDQKLQFRPSEELRTELNYQYAGMEPIEISEADLSVPAEDPEQVEKDERETLTPGPADVDAESRETAREDSDSEHTEVDDVFGLGPEQEEETEEEEAEEEQMDKGADEELSEEEIGKPAFDASSTAESDEGEFPGEIPGSDEEQVNETVEEEVERAFSEDDEDASLEDEIASELYTTRESPIEDIEQLETGLSTQLQPLGSLSSTGRDREHEDRATGPDMEDEQAEIREPSFTPEEAEQETVADTEPVEEVPEDELELEEMEQQQSEEEIFDLEPEPEEEEGEEEFDFGEIEDESRVAAAGETEVPPASDRSRRKRLAGLRHWFSRINEHFPVFPVFLISLTIVIMGFSIWMVLNPELRNNMMQKVEGYISNGEPQSPVEQKAQPPSETANRKTEGADEQKQKSRDGGRQNRKPQASGDQKQPDQPPVSADPYGMKGAWHQQGKSYTLIISSFRKRSNAGDLHNRMQQQGYRSHIQRTRVNGRRFFRVAVGQFQSVDAARRGAAQLPSSFQEAYFIRRISNN